MIGKRFPPRFHVHSFLTICVHMCLVDQTISFPLLRTLEEIQEGRAARALVQLSLQP